MRFHATGIILASGATATLSRPGDCCLHGPQPLQSYCIPIQSGHRSTHTPRLAVLSHQCLSLSLMLAWSMRIHSTCQAFAAATHPWKNRDGRSCSYTGRYMLLSWTLAIQTDDNSCTATCNTNRRSHMHGHGPCNIRAKAPQQPCLGVPRCGSLQWVHIYC